MRVSLIDIGSNSLILTVVEVNPLPLRVKELYTEVNITRLGRNLTVSRYLSEESKRKTLEVLERYLRLSCDYGVEEYLLVATAALRDARDGSSFLQEIRERTGVNCEIVSGEREGQLTVLATIREFQGMSEILHLDIGGRSTEVIQVKSGSVKWVRSLPVGSVSYTERFLVHDPVLEEEVSRMERAIQDILATLPDFSGVLVGSGGVITTLVTVKKRMREYDSSHVHKQVLTFPEVLALRELFQGLSLDERRRLPGLEPGRADVIFAGTLILESFMRSGGYRQIIVSDRGIRWGLLYEWLEKRLSKTGG